MLTFCAIFVQIQDIHDSCEPAMFSLEQLLFSVAQDIRTNVEILEVVMPMLKEVYDREIKERAEIQVSHLKGFIPLN